MVYFNVVPNSGHYRATSHEFKLIFLFKTSVVKKKCDSISMFEFSFTPFNDVLKYDDSYEYLFFVWYLFILLCNLFLVLWPGLVANWCYFGLNKVCHFKDVSDNGYLALLHSLIGKRMLFKVETRVLSAKQFEGSYYPVRRVSGWIYNDHVWSSWIRTDSHKGICFGSSFFSKICSSFLK